MVSAYVLTCDDVYVQHVAHVRASLVVKHPIQGHALITKDHTPFICDFGLDFLSFRVLFRVTLCVFYIIFRHVLLYFNFEDYIILIIRNFIEFSLFANEFST